MHELLVNVWSEIVLRHTSRCVDWCLDVLTVVGISEEMTGCCTVHMPLSRASGAPPISITNRKIILLTPWLLENITMFTGPCTPLKRSIVVNCRGLGGFDLEDAVYHSDLTLVDQRF